MKFASLLATATLLASASSQATTVYSQDFESGADAAWSGAGAVQTTAGLSAHGFGAQHLYNGVTSASVLSLSGMAAHTSLTVNFDLAIWDSVDGNPGGFPYGDTFELIVDGNPVISQLFGNYGTPGGSSMGPGTVIVDNTGNLGYGGWNDSARAVSITFAHSGAAASLSFQFPNSQGGADEAFGIDNLVVMTNAVPEPETYALMALGLLGVAAAVRRRRR